MSVFFRSYILITYYIIIQLFLVAPMTVYADETLSLKDSVVTTLEHNRQLLSAAEGVKQARAHVQEVAGDRLPQIGISTAWMYTNSPQQVFAHKLQQQSISTADFTPAALNHPSYHQNYQSRLGLSMPLFAGGALQSSQNQAEKSAQAARLEFEFQKQQKIYQMTIHYMLSLQYAEEVKYSVKSLQAAEKRWHDAQAFQRKGVTLASDVMDAHVYVLRRQVAKDQAFNAYQTSLESMALLMGSPMPLQHVTLSQPRFNLADLSLNELLELAKERRLDLQAIQQRRSAASAQRDIAYAGNYPKVDLVAAQVWNNKSAALKHGYAMLGITVSLNLFNGGSDQAKQRQAESAYIAIKWKVSEQQQFIANQVRQAWRALDITKYNYLRQQQVLQQTQESLRILSLRYQKGLETTSKVLDAQVVRDRAQVSLIRTQSDLIISKAALLLAAGLLDEGVIL